MNYMDYYMQEYFKDYFFYFLEDKNILTRIMKEKNLSRFKELLDCSMNKE